MRRSLTLLTAVVAATAASLITTNGASAGFFPAQVIDGVNTEILRVGDLDLARDGQGAVVYTRRDDGVAHAYVARFTGGTFLAPQQLDVGLTGTASQPVVGVADGGRIAAAFISDDTLFATVFNPANGTWSPLQAISAGASDPSLDLSIHGAGFLTYTASGDVRAARLERTVSQFTPVAQVLDVDPANVAGTGDGRSRVAIGADGTGIAVWGEAGRVIARRLYRTSVSTAPADLTLPDLDGRPGGVADIPEVAIEDDSSFVQVAFRQQFTDASGVQTRAITRRLRGSAVEAPIVADGSTWGAGQVDSTDIDLNGRGEGAAATGLAGGAVIAAIFKDNKFQPGAVLGGAGGPALPRVVTAETTQRVVSWMQGADNSVRSRFYEDKASVRTIPTAGPEVLVSSPDLGPVDQQGGFDLATSRLGDFMTVFIQGTPGNRRLVYGIFDRAPGAVTLYTTSTWRNPTKSSLSWSPSVDLWGGPTYVVSIDGREVGRSKTTKLLLPPAAAVPDGEHKWRVATTDIRGQVVASKSGTLRLDAVAPTGAIQLGRKKRTVTVTLTAADVLPVSGQASGVARTTISFGDGSAPSAARKVTYTYPGKKRAFTITATITDKAGNVAVVERAITLPKPKKSKKNKK